MEKIKYYYSQPLYTVNVVVPSNHRGEFKFSKVIGYSKSSLREIPRLTICSVLDVNTWTMYFGIARCNPKDNFCRATGREIALQCARENPVLVLTPPKKNLGVWRIERCLEIENSINGVTYDSNNF